MAITGYLILDKEIGAGAPWIEESLDGPASGYRAYHVNTAEEDLALLAGVAPLLGEKWSDLFPKLILRKRRTEYHTGTDTDPLVGGGWTIVHCDYATKEISVLPPQAPGVKWTECDSDLDQVTIYHAIDAVPGDENARPIRNGKGASREVTRKSIRVHVFVEKDQVGVFDDTPWHNTVNNADKELPPLLGSVKTHKAPKGTLLYRCSRIIPREKVDEIVFELGYSIDHLEHWRDEDEDGAAVGDEKTARVYFEADFAGLW